MDSISSILIQAFKKEMVFSLDELSIEYSEYFFKKFVDVRNYQETIQKFVLYGKSNKLVTLVNYTSNFLRNVVPTN